MLLVSVERAYYLLAAVERAYYLLAAVSCLLASVGRANSLLAIGELATLWPAIEGPSCLLAKKVLLFFHSAIAFVGFRCTSLQDALSPTSETGFFEQYLRQID